MSKIACKMRNSFALDNKNKLFTWGSWETGLLANNSEADILRPNMIDLYHGRDRYDVDKVSCGHFHVAVVANRECASEPKELKYAANLFNELKGWYEEIFIKNINNPYIFIKMLLRKTEQSKENIKFEEFEKFFLQPFYAFQKLNNKDIFKMNKIYQEHLYSEFGLSSKKLTFSPVELIKLSETTNQYLKELHEFALHCVNHFKKNPEDFPFFIRIVMRFEPYIKLSDVINLYEYVYNSEYKYSKSTLELEKPKIIQLFNDLKENVANKKDEFVVNTNALIDTIEKKQTGIGVVFTWGVSSECRLGYDIEEKEKSQNVQFKKEEEEEELIQQTTPRIVYFKNVFIRISKVSCGYAHTLALSDEARVYSWGSSKYGCLGLSTSNNQKIPEIISKDFEKDDFKEIVDIAAGMYCSIALENDGVLYTWGCGSGGRLGHGDENSVGLPKKVAYFLSNDIKISNISCGDTHCAVVSSSKSLYSWGNGTFGKLGHGNFEDVKTPMMVEFFNNKQIDMVVCGSHNSMAITSDLRIYAWGKNSHGMLGIPQKVDQNIIIPTEVPFTETDVVIRDISLGTMHTMFLCSSGFIYTCGNTVNGILALPEVYDKQTFPKRIQDTTFFETIMKDIFVDSIFKQYYSDFTLNLNYAKYATSSIYAACSSYNTAFITNNGELYMCGESSLICEGNGKKEIEAQTTEKEATPTTGKGGMIAEGSRFLWKDNIVKITKPELSGKVTYIALGNNHVICIANKKPYSWGKNVYGVLGLSNKSVGETVQTPTLIEKITSMVKMAAVSDSHSLILTTNGEIYACGSNLYGKLGIGDLHKYFEFNESLDVPYETEPRVVKNVTYAEYIACSNNHSACIMKYDKKFALSYMVYTWGSGFLGKLGHYDLGDVSEPKKVEELENKVVKISENEKLYFVKIAVGDEFTFALDIKGGLWGWGKKKYLVANSETEEGFQTTPISIMPNIQFKNISSSANFCLALDVGGNLYSWGKLPIDGKTVIKPFEKIFCEKMDFVACGVNHFLSIEAKTLTPYTWGSNLFFKCGQNFSYNLEGTRKLDEEVFQKAPKKLDYFFDYFFKNNLIIESEKELKKMQDLMKCEYENPKEKAYEKCIETQLRLMDEKMEYKNVGLLSEDYKINQRFYEVTADYFNTMRSIEDSRLSESMKIENSIISVINEAKSKKIDIYKSDVPKVLSQNFQLFEAALVLIQTHPCYLQKAQKFYKNKVSFIELVKMVFGRNYINMRNRRVILMLMALWNATFKEETAATELNTNLKTTDRYEDFLTYDLYDLIFKINKENMQIIYEITSELFLFFIAEILDKADIIPSKDEDILSHYKDMGEIKNEICKKAIHIIADKITYLFREMKENLKNNFSYSVIWIYKRISKLFKNNNNEKDKSQFNKLFNYFLFVPFVDMLKSIKDSYDESQCKEYKFLLKKIPQVLEQNKSKSGFSQLFNLYKSDKQNTENSYFKKVCSPKSDILKQVYDIFVALSKREDKFAESEEYIMEMNKTCRQSLKNYQYDFTLTAFKELVKSLSDNGNESIIVPLSIKDIIELRDCLNNISASNLGHDNDPLKSIISYINEFKLDDLDSNSKIRNFVINFYIKPNNYYYNTLLGSPKIIKCDSCLLPIHHVFFNNVTNYTEWTEWTCNYCQNKPPNEKHLVLCKSLICGRPKSKSVIKKQKTFFKLFKIPNEEVEVLMFEDVLRNLHYVSENDDIIKEIEIAIEKFRLQKSRDKNKIQLMNNFLNFINLKVGNFEDGVKAENIKKECIKKLLSQVEENYKQRVKHLAFLNNLNDFISFLDTNAENAKANFLYSTKLYEVFLFNVKRGFANVWAKQMGSLTKALKQKNENTEEKNVIKKFLVVELLNKKVIDEILFQSQQQPKLTQKTYILFEKEAKGYKIKLNYKEKYRKFIICGVNTHEYILEEHPLPNEAIMEMRKNARNNPTINLGDIRFNIFYLVKLLNSLETLD